MSGHALWPWAVVLLLGAVHGLNPAMGWLLAVARGMQDGRGTAVWRTVPPLALGHGLAIGAVATLAATAGLLVPLSLLQWVIAALLVGMGLWRLLWNRHPRCGGMRVGARDLTIWSLLMATAHGAGLMVLPFLMPAAVPAPLHAAHAAGPDAGGSPMGAVTATALHTVGYLVVTGLVAAVVYHRLGLRLLRKVWVNVDLIWAGALIVTGVLTPVL